MEELLDQQAELLKVGEDLLRRSSDAMREAVGPDALRKGYEVWMGFYHAVDWTESWIRCVLAMEVLTLIAAVALRKSETAQTVLFVWCMLVAFSARTLNEWGGRHWRSFSKQNYFDENGFFISTVLSTPMMVTQVVVLVNFFRLMVSMMIMSILRRNTKTRVRSS